MKLAAVWLIGFDALPIVSASPESRDVSTFGTAASMPRPCCVVGLMPFEPSRFCRNETPCAPALSDAA